MMEFDQTAEFQFLSFKSRRLFVLAFLLLAMLALVVRAVYLQVVDKPFLQKRALQQYSDTMSVPAYRGKILDRQGDALAVSTPVQAVILKPYQVKGDGWQKIEKVAEILQLPRQKLRKIRQHAANKRFLYLKRQVNPEVADKIREMKAPGIFFEDALQRFYPSGEIAGHLIGFTNIDDVGQEGIERQYESLLQGKSGLKRVIRDGKGHIIKDVEIIREPVAGKDLDLSIDNRIQYLAYRELKAAVIAHKAAAAALVVLNAKTGEVLAVVNQPAFNPNNRKRLKARNYRNRAFVDVFEPGSTVKPLVMLAALDGGYVSPAETIETHGFYRLQRRLIKDTHNYKTLDLTGIIKKSSNVAISKIALRMPAEYLWNSYQRLGFGQPTWVGFPGEARGRLPDYPGWSEFEQATLSFGYGLSVSALQLARAYTALADDGILHSVSLLPREKDEQAERVFSVENTRRVRKMMEAVVEKGGTATQAQVPGFRVAGKTGTAKKSEGKKGYSDKDYIAAFVGMAPASDPQYVIAVMVDTPSAGQYYGGQVAAPVFSRVMAGVLRIYGVAPDQEETMPVLLTNDATH
jgi:cell division protein FtsI (penicillin-binding protein 3)